MRIAAHANRSGHHWCTGTAQNRTDDEHFADIGAEIAATPLWSRYVGPVWSVLMVSC
jgi:hypothetical protein